MLGSNYTFLVDVTHTGETIPAVYKPSRGEQPLWDFEENTLALREVAAYIVGEGRWMYVICFDSPSHTLPSCSSRFALRVRTKFPWRICRFSVRV